MPRILTFYDFSPLQSRHRWSDLQNRLLALMVRASLRQAEAVQVISHTMRAEVIATGWVPAERIFVGYPEASSIFGPGSDPPSLLARYSLEPQAYFLSVGTLLPRKNYPTLLDAYGRWRAQSAVVNPPRLVIVGNRWQDYRAVQELHARHPNRDSIDLLENVLTSDLPGLYRQARALIFPSLYEGFGIPILEAMACGCPVLCSELPIFREVAGDAALYFDPQDLSELASLLGQTGVEELAAVRQRAAKRSGVGWPGAGRSLLDALEMVQAGLPRGKP